MILVDTNVLLDVLAKREPFYSSAAAVWSAVETGTIDVADGQIAAIARRTR